MNVYMYAYIYTRTYTYINNFASKPHNSFSLEGLKLVSFSCFILMFHSHVLFSCFIAVLDKYYHSARVESSYKSKHHKAIENVVCQHETY